MPRKSGRKGGSRATKKVVSDDAKVEQEKPSRKSKNDSSDIDRTRRSSTAAQTAASVAESRVTRTRAGRRDSASPTEGRRTAGRDSESARVRSSRRAAGRVNYKESDGEEEVPTPKNDNYVSEEEFNESDSDEKDKPKRGARSPPKRAVASRSKGRGQAAAHKRGQPGKRKVNAEVIKDDEEPASPSEDGAEPAKNIPKEESDPLTNQKSPIAAAKSEPVEKFPQKSSRSARAVRTEASVSKRPSRGTKVKKYTEVDEDFDEDIKIDEEEKRSGPDPDVKEMPRKRKRESEYEPNKRSKRESPENEEQKKPAGLPATGDSDDIKKDEESSDEPMEIDVSFSDAEEGKNEQKSKTEEVKEASKEQVSHNASKIEQDSEDSSSIDEADNVTKPSNHVEKASDVETDVKKVEPESRNDSSVDSTEVQTPGVIRSVEKELSQASVIVEKPEDEMKSVVNCTPSAPNPPSVQENTFLSKEQLSNVSYNGESDKAVVSDSSLAQPEKMSNFLYQNSTLPKANGSSQRTYSGEQIAGREYVVDSHTLSMVKGQQENAFLRFGFVSCNLSLTAIHKEKLVHELDKQASIICLQNVSKSLFHDVLVRSFDALGFKATACWTKDTDYGLATFYKASTFKLIKDFEMPVKMLLQKKMDMSDLEDGEKSIISQFSSKCGDVLCTQLASVYEDDNIAVTVANVEIPSNPKPLHALQLACLSQELAVFSERQTKHLLVCGKFGASETELPYQIFRHGKLNDQLLEEMKSRADTAENSTVVKLLRSMSRYPCIKLSSCYNTVLGKELSIAESKLTSPDLMFSSGEGLHTVGVWDLPSNYAERLSQGQIPLKADLAIALPPVQKDA